jgi:glycosyltransferase involved in cell wall biosynthesis
MGAEVELFSPRVEGDPPPDLSSLVVHALPAIPTSDAVTREQTALAGNSHLYERLQRAGPFDLVYERYSLWSVAGMQYARVSGVPGLLEVNAPLIEEQAAYRGLVDRASAEQVAERVFADAESIIAVSTGVRTYLHRYPAARGRVHLVANGVNPARFPPGATPSHPGSTESFTVGFVGSLKPWHGLAILVDAFARLHASCPSTRLLVVGDGPQRKSLEADLSARQLSGAAEIVGAVAPSAVAGLLASMDVAVAPYPQQEHFYFSPLKVYEYMAAGIPVVASRIGDLPDLIQDGRNGLLCRPGDAVELAAALVRLQQDAELRVRLGLAGRQSVLQHHTWDAIARRILNMAGVVGVSESRFAEMRI